MSQGNGKSFLDAASILGAKPRMKEVDVPGWGGRVWVRGLSARHQDLVRAIIAAGKQDDGLFRARLAAWSIVDERGARLFSEDDIEALAEKDGAPLDCVWRAALELTTWADSAATAEGAEKNSASAMSADSPSA